jgi:hypothetical protein
MSSHHVVVRLAVFATAAALAGAACGGAPASTGSARGAPYGSNGGGGATSVSGLPATTTTTVPGFPGAGTGVVGISSGSPTASIAPLAPGCTPASASECPTTSGNCATSANQHVDVKAVGSNCYYSASATTTPDATLEYIHELAAGQDYYRFRLTFDPSFVDNTYGANAIGWGGAGGTTGVTTTTTPTTTPGMPGGKMMPMMMPMMRSGHTFNDLVGSDHAEMLLVDAAGKQTVDANIDYISVDQTRPCGYGNLGVRGGEGKVMTGDPSWILAATSSLDRDLNGCGYCTSSACGGSCTVSSPATDAAYTPNTATPRWDYRVVYEIWVSAAAFGAAGFGSANITFVHASPSKASSNTVTVQPGPCPPSWKIPYTTPGTMCPAGTTSVIDEFLRVVCVPPQGGSCPAGTMAVTDEFQRIICVPSTGGIVP